MLGFLLQTSLAHQALVDDAVTEMVPDELIQDDIVPTQKQQQQDIDPQAFDQLDQMTQSKQKSIFHGKDFNYLYTNYPYEVYMMAGFIGLIILMFVGKSRNRD